MTTGVDLTLVGLVEGNPYTFLIDTGALISLFKGELYHGRVRKSSVDARGITGNKIAIKGVADMCVNIAGEMFDLAFHLCDLDLPYHGILGLDSLRKLGVVIDFSVDEIRLAALQTGGERGTGTALPADVTHEGVANLNEGRGEQEAESSGEVKTSPDPRTCSEEERVWRVVTP